MIYLHENGVTVVATDEAKRGKVYELNGEEYYIARGVSDIKRIVDSGEYPLNRVVTSKLTSFNCLFQIKAGYAQRAVPENFNDDITNWDTSNVTEMEEVFTGWPDFNQDISNWDTSMVESMYGMFKSSKYVGSYYMGDTSFNQDISKWDVRNVKNMSEMFLGATSFNQDISGWDVSNVENMDYMFSGAISFNQPIGNWDVSNVKTMLGMFSDVTSIGIMAFVGTYEYNRAGSTSFNQPIGNWDVSNVEDMAYMFSGATSFNQDISNWDVSNVQSMDHMFSGGRIDSLIPINWNEVNPLVNTNPTSFNQPIGNWDVSNVTSMSSMFSGATSFNQPIGTWNVSSVEYMDYMFRGATSFNQPIGNWNLSTGVNMENMFSGAISFNQDLNGWNAVFCVKGMFYGATSFNSPIGKWNVNAVTDMENMFREATSFNQDISSWDVSNVIQMKGIFQDATSLDQDLTSWKLNEKLPKSRTMFTGATAFKIKEHSPFLNVKTKKRKVDTSTANLSSEDKRIYSKIKKLIVSRDTDKIDLGVELAVSLNNSSVFNSLLTGCELIHSEEQWGEMTSKLATNKLFTGSGPAQPYLNYALMSLIANAPDNDEIEIDESIKIKNIKELNLSTISTISGVTPDINNFKFLEKLIISQGLRTRTKAPDSLKELKCTGAVGSLKWLSSLNQLEKLFLQFASYGDDITDIDSFKNLVSLKDFEFETGEVGHLTDINFLSECKRLEKLKFSISGRYYNEEDITDISVLSKLTNLESLEILDIKDQDISPIGSCKKLKNLSIELSENYEDWDFSILNSCKELNYLNIKGGGLYQINAQIENINGIKLPKNLYSIKLGNSLVLSGIDGMNLLNKNSKSINKNEFKRASFTEIIDKGDVSYFQGKPFTGIMYYHYKYDIYRNNQDDSQPVVYEYEMVDGLKHGSFRQYYIGGKLTGNLKLEHNFANDQHDKIVGFYDGQGNNYVEKDLCVGANSLVFKRKNKIPHVDAMGDPIETDEVFTNVKSYGKGYPLMGSLGYNPDQDNPDGLKDALFYYNNKPFSGQVLFHKHVSNWNLSKEKDFAKSLYAYLDSSIKDHIPGSVPDDDDYISFLITIKNGRLTGKFCASLNDKFFSGTTNEEGTQSPLSTMEVNDSSIQNSNELSLVGKSIVITGVFENYSRNELKALIKENGGSPSSSVTSNTFLIVAGSKMGPKKKVLAEKLGVKIIDVDNFIKEYINKKDNENSEAKTNFINMFYPDLADKKTVSKKKLKSEDKKTFTKIKSFLQSRDFDKIDMGIELLRSINVVEFYEALLADCKISSGKDQKITANKFFTGSGPAQPYLNYALYLLIYYCPDEAEVEDSLRKENINFLDTNSLFEYSYEHKYRLPLIENFTSLKELNIKLGSFNIGGKPEDVLKNSSVEKITIEPNGSLSWLKNFPQIKSLSFGPSSYYAKKATDYDSFNYLINLEELEISCGSEENIDFLKNCVNIKKLTLNLGPIQYNDTMITKNLDALKYLKKLEELEINGGSRNRTHNYGNLSFSGLSTCKNLKTLSLYITAPDEALTSLKNCSSLEKIYFSSITNCKIKLNMLSLNGISKLDKLKNISLNGVSLVQSKSKLFID